MWNLSSVVLISTIKVSDVTLANVNASHDNKKNYNACSLAAAGEFIFCSIWLLCSAPIGA